MGWLTDLFWGNALGILSWIVRIGAFVVVPFRRSAAEARTWLLAFFAAPIPALLIYLIIGRPEHSHHRKALFAQLPGVLERALRRSGMAIGDGGPDATDRIAASVRSVSELVSGLASLPPLDNNSCELMPDYEGTIARLIEDIDRARHYVHLQFYIFADDATGKAMVDALARAETRGVQCRVLVDAMGSFGFSRKTERRLQEAGADVHRILPLKRRWSASRIDLRNHRKIVVIDGCIGYTGSQNVVDAQVSEGFVHQELMCRLRGPVVAGLQLVFLGDWYLETEAELHGSALFDFERDVGTAVCQVLPTGPDYRTGRIDMVFAEMIHSARHAITIATPYFIPNEALVQAFKTATARGVTVTLILSRRLDSRIVSYAQRSYYTELMEGGVDITLFQPDFLHAKHVRIDDSVALIGSSNMDMRSFELNAEISVLAYDSDTIDALRGIEDRFLASSESLDLEEWEKRPRLSKMAENSMRLLSDLL